MTRVMVVDDSEIDLAIIKCQIEDAGFEVVSSLDPSLAVEMVKKYQPDVILLDIVMDKSNGFEVCAKLKGDKDTSHIPIMFVSSSKNEENIIMGMHLGVVDFLHKPVDRDKLIHSIKIHDHMHKIDQALKQMVSEL